MPRTARRAIPLAAALAALAACGGDEPGRPVRPLEDTLATVIDGTWVGFDADTTGGAFSLIVRVVPGAADASGVRPITGTANVSRSMKLALLTVAPEASRYAVTATAGDLTLRVTSAAGDRIDVACRIAADQLYACPGTAVDAGGRTHAIRFEKLRPID